MGEARMRDMVAEQAAKQLEAAKEKPIQLPVNKVAGLLALDRAIALLAMEGGQLAEMWQERELAGEIAGAVEHLTKARARFFAESQRRIVVPTPKVVL